MSVLVSTIILLLGHLPAAKLVLNAITISRNMIGARISLAMVTTSFTVGPQNDLPNKRGSSSIDTECARALAVFALQLMQQLQDPEANIPPKVPGIPPIK